jgi:hypothetical protein
LNGSLVHGQGNAVKIPPHNPPGRVPEYNNGYFSPRQILLMPDSLVGREQNVETRGLSHVEQPSRAQRISARLKSGALSTLRFNSLE